MINKNNRFKKCHRSRQSGQAAVFLMLALGLFLLGAMGFAVDMANLWYHRQSAQTAADAACVAGGMDLLIDGTNHVPNQGGFVAGTSFDCAGTSGVAPCQYAALNGYDGKNLSPGNDVFVDFPATVAGVAALPPGMASYQFIRVKVTDHVQNSFSACSAARKRKMFRQSPCAVSSWPRRRFLSLFFILRCQVRWR